MEGELGFPGRGISPPESAAIAEPFRLLACSRPGLGVEQVGLALGRGWIDTLDLNAKFQGRADITIKSLVRQNATHQQT